MTFGRTPSQTAGPFFGFALPWLEGPHLVGEGTADVIRLEGCLLDGYGEPVPDGLVETWQADPSSLSHTEFRGFGRCPTDRDGRYEIRTLKPGSVRDRNGTIHAPHVAVSVFARGLLKRAVTRIYFPDEQAANEVDPVLSSIADVAARATLVARPSEGGYRFDIRLQGEGETVFFDV
jgi:protocatechuate 3,4-dioxygenase alpha subunit